MGLFNKSNDPYNSFEANDDFLYEDEDYESYENDRQNNFKLKLIAITMFYVCFLVLGIFSTSFTINNVGEKEAQVVTVNLREEREYYFEIREHYFTLTNLMMEIETIDQRLTSANEAAYFEISTQYSDKLTIINSRITSAKALNMPKKYESIKNQAISLYDVSSIYLQKISSALVSKDNKTLEEAITWKETMHNEYASFKNNMFNFSKMIKLNDKTYEQYNGQ